MSAGTDIFLHDGEVAWTDLGGGVKRKILTHDASVMMVRVVFEKGAVGAPHQHPTNLVHGVVALEAGELVDTFTPRREDFL